MKTWIKELLLWLFVINLGIALGAGFYERAIEVPRWLSFSPEAGYQWNAEAARQANTGVNFWVYVTTVPLTLLTLANLVVAWRAQGTVRKWWVAAAGAALVGRIFTFTYFIPTMLRLMSDETIPQSEAVATALQWANLDYVRHIIGLVALLAALKAFSLFRVSSERLSSQWSAPKSVVSSVRQPEGTNR